MVTDNLLLYYLFFIFFEMKFLCVFQVNLELLPLVSASQVLHASLSGLFAFCF